MPRKSPFNWIERQLLKIPTWLFVSGAVVILGGIILWVAPAEERDSFAGGVRVLLGGVESIAIVSAVILYFKEIPDRKAQKHYEAWQVIDAASGVETSYARYKALEDLNRDGVSLKGIDVPGADLQGIDLAYADLIYADLRDTKLTIAKLTITDLRSADLRGARLVGTDLGGAWLMRANLFGADLRGANLSFADLSNADLSNADLSRVNRLTEEQLATAKLCNTKLPDYIKLDPNRDCPPDESAQEPNLSSEQEPEAEA